MPKELEDNLMTFPWPPKIKLGEKEEEIQLTELDVNWMYCTLLGMKWSDACAVTDDLQRRFLYNKSMEIAASSANNQSELEEEKKRIEEKIDGQLKEIKDGLNAPPKL